MKEYLYIEDDDDALEHIMLPLKLGEAKSILDKKGLSEQYKQYEKIILTRIMDDNIKNILENSFDLEHLANAAQYVADHPNAHISWNIKRSQK
jgi:hypothetical protein